MTNCKIETGKLTAKLRDAVPVCLMQGTEERKRYKNIELPDDIKKLPSIGYDFNVPADGKITFKIFYDTGVLPATFPEPRAKGRRNPKGAEPVAAAAKADAKPAAAPAPKAADKPAAKSATAPAEKNAAPASKAKGKIATEAKPAALNKKSETKEDATSTVKAPQSKTIKK